MSTTCGFKGCLNHTYLVMPVCTHCGKCMCTAAATPRRMHRSARQQRMRQRCGGGASTLASMTSRRGWIAAGKNSRHNERKSHRRGNND
ncbi:hypothetical protein C3747_66g110 [Trypanosoma cruzi]|uniref:Uncharacterized protein n=2 Tax=Trypanosoma cruzi TaxID=5693 RepID=Q4DF51_TRYCC|nr:hypothetical protein, conserved [Trypanosoma cruzi]EAN91162.1 hypothetical protein, conserved [Trypanosoma cruzi]PWV10769.1 hypothetical protein C3747_66g110 [Trypanosoma cruzi]|eukprot:XP_813013.1 hypothetical protein [Trypanosoma cruzi strain CL Brener]